LHSELIGRIGCQSKGRVYVVPVTYVYDSESVYCHSANGLKLQMMRENPQVCFEVERIYDLGHWQTVIAQGTFEELEGAAAKFAMELLVDRLEPTIVSETSGPVHETGARGGPDGTAHVFRIKLKERSGRFEARRTGT
jgi:hypothetical protein